MPRGNTPLGQVEQAKSNLKKLDVYIKAGMELAQETALDVIDHEHCIAHTAEVTELRRIMMEYAKMDEELNQFIEATEAVQEMSKNSEEKLDLATLLDEKLHEARQENREQDIRQHEKVVDFDKRVEDMMKEYQSDGVLQPKGPTQIDDDLAIEEPETQTKCPYTGKDMVNPVTNKLCHHSYDREGIEGYMKLRKGKAKCPVPGCINDKPLHPDDLLDNADLKRFIDLKRRQENKKGKK